ncbi:MAG: hypothetical protein AAB597_01655 [Patescibacteria group bacterium]
MLESVFVRESRTTKAILTLWLATLISMTSGAWLAVQFGDHLQRKNISPAGPQILRLRGVAENLASNSLTLNITDPYDPTQEIKILVGLPPGTIFKKSAPLRGEPGIMAGGEDEPADLKEFHPGLPSTVVVLADGGRFVAKEIYFLSQ